MKEKTTRDAKDGRKAQFAEIIAQSKLTPTEFRQRTGITRNVFYNLSIGQIPKAEHRERINGLFAELSLQLPYA